MTETKTDDEVARLRQALLNLVGPDVSYHGNEIRITCTNHGDAIRLVREARAALRETMP